MDAVWCTVSACAGDGVPYRPFLDSQPTSPSLTASEKILFWTTSVPGFTVRVAQVWLHVSHPFATIPGPVGELITITGGRPGAVRKVTTFSTHPDETPHMEVDVDSQKLSPTRTIWPPHWGQTPQGSMGAWRWTWLDGSSWRWKRSTDSTRWGAFLVPNGYVFEVEIILWRMVSVVHNALISRCTWDWW